MANAETTQNAGQAAGNMANIGFDLNFLASKFLQPAIDKASTKLSSEEWRENVEMISGMLATHQGLHIVCVTMLKAKIKSWVAVLWNKDHKIIGGLALMNALMVLQGTGFSYTVMKKCLPRIFKMASPTDAHSARNVVREYAAGLVYIWADTYGTDARLIEFSGAAASLRALERKMGIDQKNIDGTRVEEGWDSQPHSAERWSANSLAPQAGAPRGRVWSLPPPVNPYAAGISHARGGGGDGHRELQSRMSDFHLSALRNSEELKAWAAGGGLGGSVEAEQGVRVANSQQHHVQQNGGPEGDQEEGQQRRSQQQQQQQKHRQGGQEDGPLDLGQVRAQTDVLREVMREAGGERGGELVEHVASRCRASWKILRGKIPEETDTDILAIMIALNDDLSTLLTPLSLAPSPAHAPSSPVRPHVSRSDISSAAPAPRVSRSAAPMELLRAPAPGAPMELLRAPAPGAPCDPSKVPQIAMSDHIVRNRMDLPDHPPPLMPDLREADDVESLPAGALRHVEGGEGAVAGLAWGNSPRPLPLGRVLPQRKRDLRDQWAHNQENDDFFPGGGGAAGGVQLDEFDQLVSLDSRAGVIQSLESNAQLAEAEVLSDASLRDHDKAKLLSWIDRFSHACRRALSGPVGGGLSMLILQKGKSGLEHLKDVQMVSCVGAPPPGGEAPARGGATPGRSEMKV